MSYCRFRLVCLSPLVLVLCQSGVAWAQGRSTPATTLRWGVEFYGGFTAATNPASGTGQLPPLGPTFVTTGDNASRMIPSWFFGDGATILNNKLAANLFTGRVDSLDSMLTSSTAVVGQGPLFGVRLTRHVNPRFSIDLGADFVLQSIHVTDQADAALHSAGSSFRTAFTQLLMLAATSSTTTASVTIDDGSGVQCRVGADLRVHLITTGTFRPHVFAGVSAILEAGTDSAATISGSYQFVRRNAPFPPFDETDTLVIRYTSGNTYGFRFGGGFTHDLSPRYGIRADLAMTLSPNRLRINIDTGPSSVIGSPTGVTTLGGQPGIQFSTVEGVQTTLGLPLHGFETYSGGGWRVQTGVVGGLFVKF